MADDQETTFYSLPAVMPVPYRPQAVRLPEDPEDDAWAGGVESAIMDLNRWASDMHRSIYDNYIPQTDRIENMVMVGETLSGRPDAIGSRRFFYHRPNNVLYLDVRYAGENFWDIVFSQDASIIELDTTNFDGILSPTDADLQVAMDTIDDHIHPAEDITVDVTSFGGTLGPTDDDVQHALETLDNLSHTDLQDIGTYTHAEIDTHIDDATIHFTVGSIDHGSISGLADDDHPHYLLADGTRELTGDWGLGNTYGITEIPFFDFYTAYAGGHQEARMHWNDDDGCLNIGMKGGNVELQTGLELLIQGRNISGVTISNGEVVKITGATGNKPKFELANTSQPWSGYSVIGVATEDISNNSNGYVTTTGLVRDVDTSAWAEGDALYLSNATPGALTNVYPTAPEIMVHVGVVVRQHASEGVILVTPRVVPPMTLLADTFGTPSADGDFYTWDQTTDLRFELDNIGDYLRRDEWLENGFDDASDTALAWDDASRTLTLSPAVTSFDYHYAGYKYTESGNLSAQITDTEGLWVFYIGSGGAASLSTIHNPSYSQVEDAILNQCIVAYVYWDAANNDGRLMDERHGSIMGRGAHHYLHEIMGSQYLSGMTLGDITTDQNGNTDSHAQFSITAGRFYDEDIEHDTLAHASTDTWESYYVDGSGNVRWVNCEATFPVYAIGGVIAYNNAGTLTAVTSNKYVLYHVFATNIHTDSGGDYYPVVTPGIAVYNSKADAQDAAATEIQSIDFGDWPKEEIIPVATVIYHHGAAMSNGVEAAIQSTEGGGDFVDWRFTNISGSSTSVNDHGALSGLADDDHPQYLPLTAGSGRSLSGDLYIDENEFVRSVSTGLAGATINLIRLDDAGGPEVEVGDTQVPIDFLGTRFDFNGDVTLPSGDLYLDDASDPSIYLREGASATSYSLVRDETSEKMQLIKVGAADTYIDIESRCANGNDSHVRFNRFTNTSGGVDLIMYVGDNSSTVQHQFNCDGGDVDLCQQGGQVTIGGTGGAEKANVVGGNLLFDNNYGIRCKDTGGTVREIFKIASSNLCNMGSSANRAKIFSSDYLIQPVGTSAIGDAGLAASTMVAWVDESGHTLNFKVKYSDGTTVKSGSIALT